MPICIECRYPVPQLYHVLHSNSNSNNKNPQKQSPHQSSQSIPPKTYAPTNPTSRIRDVVKGSGVAGGDVRLTQCPRCKRFADKYVEHDFVVLFIDLVLVKPQVYRHLLFNRLGRSDDALDPSILRLGTLLLLFDVYLTWSTIESLPPPPSSPIPPLPIPLQYIFYLLLSTLTTLSHHLALRFLASLPAFNPKTNNNNGFYPQSTSTTTSITNPPTHQSTQITPSALSTALVVSSCMRLFPLLMVVWKYDDANNSVVAWGVEWAVAIQNIEAVRILLGCRWVSAGVLVGAGAGVRWVVRGAILGAVGLGSGVGW